MSDCLFRPTRSTSFGAQVRGLITYLARGLISLNSALYAWAPKEVDLVGLNRQSDINAPEN
jgi:hypothetical protein